MYNLEKVFELVDVNFDRVVIKVNSDDPLTTALYPFIPGNTAYISVTRGKDHTLTVVKKDNSTFNFNWGRSGHTLISDSLVLLKKQTIRFINDNGILLDYTGGTITETKIYYNPSYKAWQLRMETTTGDCNYFSSSAKSFEDMEKECEKFVTADWVLEQGSRFQTREAFDADYVMR